MRATMFAGMIGVTPFGLVFAPVSTSRCETTTRRRTVLPEL